MTRALVDTAPLRSSAAFRRLWITQALSGLGSQFTLIAVLYSVWLRTASTVWTGATGLAQALPLITFGLLAGALIDRRDRRLLYLLASAGQAVFSLILAAQSLFGQLPVIGLLAMVAGQSCFGCIGAPAARTFIPRLLPAPQVAAGLALNRITFQASTLIGPAAAGLLIAAAGVGTCYLVDAVSFSLACGGAFGLPAMSPEGEPGRPGLAGVLDGLRFLTRTPVVRGALVTDLACTVLSFPISLFPLVNRERFDSSPRTFGLFLTAIALGGVLASLLSGSFTRLPRPGVLVLLGSAGWGACMAVFAMVGDRWLALLVLVLAGVADTVSVVSRGTIVALSTPDQLRGRVAAAEQIVGQAGPDLGNLRAGLVAGASSATTALISGGLLCLLAVALVDLSTPQLRRLGVAPPSR